MGMYYIVSDDRGEEGVRFIVAEFSRRVDAKEFAQNAGGELVSEDQSAEIADLVRAWHDGDFSRQARVEAGQLLAEWYHALGNAPTDFREELIEQYADRDSLCELALDHLRELAALKASLNSAIPPGRTKFYGVHVRGEWKPSPEAVAFLEERKAAKEAAEG
jgi:hypothetical protein